MSDAHGPVVLNLYALMEHVVYVEWLLSSIIVKLKVLNGKSMTILNDNFLSKRLHMLFINGLKGV